MTCPRNADRTILRTATEPFLTPVFHVDHENHFRLLLL